MGKKKKTERQENLNKKGGSKGVLPPKTGKGSGGIETNATNQNRGWKEEIH